MRRISVMLHRDLGFFFAGIVCIYAISGIFMNHRKDVNPNCTVELSEWKLQNRFPADAAELRESDVLAVLANADVDPAQVTRHYFVKKQFKILIKGGSSITVNPASGEVLYEKITPRPLVSQMVRLHYNPGRWWTVFSDIFAVGLLVLVVTGCVIVKGRKGIWGRGGVELLLGIAIPVIFLLIA